MKPLLLRAEINSVSLFPCGNYQTQASKKRQKKCAYKNKRIKHETLREIKPLAL